MEQPSSFMSTTYPYHVCLLHKSIYGLKQAPHVSFAKLSSSILSFGFKYSHVDNSLFIHRTSTRLILLLVYVDDVILTSNDLFFIS